MQFTDGFKRRVGITVKGTQKSIYQSLYEHNAAEKRPQPSSVPKMIQSSKNIRVKFNKINEANHAIILNRKKNQQFHKIVDEIQERGQSFFRMGFKSFQKKTNRKVFSDVLNLGKRDMKGTMHVGQLWSNHQLSKYLKDNRIFMNKLKLMDKLHTLKKQFDEKHESYSSTEIGASMRSIENTYTTQCLIHQNQQKDETKEQFNHTLKKIKKNLKELVKQQKQKINTDIKGLERYQDRMEKVQKKFFVKMIDLY